MYVCTYYWWCMVPTIQNSAHALFSLALCDSRHKPITCVANPVRGATITLVIPYHTTPSTSTMMMIPSTLPHTWLSECRNPVFTWTIGETAYGFYLSSLPTWIELLVLAAAHMLMAALFSVLIYYTIIKKQRKTFTTFLLTFGIYLPFWVLAPRTVLDMWGFQNKLFRFTLLVITPTLSSFRLMEAFFGFTPPHATRSVADFGLYYGSALIARFDNKTQKYVQSNTRIAVLHLSRFLFLLFLTGMYQSMFNLHPYFPTLGVKVQETENYYSLRHVIHPSKWKDTALYAILLQQYLTTFGEGLMFATNVLTGIQTQKIMLNPMFASASPSDFWGRRWNLLIHASLKGAVYKPVLSLGGPQSLAVLAAFVASALFHEWVLVGTFLDYPNQLGANTVFFVWQAMLVAVEFLLVKWNLLPKRMIHSIPKPVRSILVVLCGVPFGRWFLESYVCSNFFEQGHMVMMSVLPLHFGS